MAEYINIRGQSIEVVASDPANPTIGQIWYNSTSNTLKGFSVTTVGTWATGNSMGTGRNRMGSFGLQTAAVAATGTNGTGRVQSTENYDGTSWSPSGNTPVGKEWPGGAGTQTAGLIFGGYLTTGVTNTTEEYDGATWTSSGNLGTASIF
jgi:hypothetical protein